MNEINNMFDIVRGFNDLSNNVQKIKQSFPQKTLGDEEFTEGVTSLSPEETLLPNYILVDTGKNYIEFNHSLALFVVNGPIDQNNTTVTPITIDNNPEVCNQNNNENYGPYIRFVKENLQALQDVANQKIDGYDFLSAIEKYRDSVKKSRFSC